MILAIWAKRLAVQDCWNVRLGNALSAEPRLDAIEVCGFAAIVTSRDCPAFSRYILEGGKREAIPLVAAGDLPATIRGAFLWVAY
jgi:hypothetical protein